MLCDFLKLVKKKSMKPKDDLVVELLGIQNVCIYKILLLILVPMEKCQSNDVDSIKMQKMIRFFKMFILTLQGPTTFT